MNTKRYKSLADIARIIRHPSFSKQIRGVKEWVGADVIITADKNRQYSSKYIVVYTRHAQALSWLIEQLKYIFCPDCFWKYEFYGNLATAAIRYLYGRMSAEQLNKLSEQEQQNLAQFLNSDSSKFQQLVDVASYECQVDCSAKDEDRVKGLLMAVVEEAERMSYRCQIDCSAGDEDSSEGLLMAVLQEAERMSNEYYVKLFVYGTLKRGESNHSYLENAEFLGDDEVENAQLFDLGAYPMMLSGEGIVKGELYYVPLKTVQLLDVLEGHPNYFHQDWLMLKSGTTALVYLGKKKFALKHPLISSGQWRDRF